MTVGTKYSQVFQPVVMSVAVDVVKFEGSWLPPPFCESAGIASRFQNSFLEAVSLEPSRLYGGFVL